jgi:hypothetical protein
VHDSGVDAAEKCAVARQVLWGNAEYTYCDDGYNSGGADDFGVSIKYG